MAQTNSRTIENFLLIWLDANQSLRDTITKSAIINFQQFVNLVLLFNDADQCVNYLSDIRNEKIFLIVSDIFGQRIISFLNHFDQIDSIYVLCQKTGKTEKWAENEKKIKGVFTKIEPIYDAVRRDIRQCQDDLIPFSISSSTYDQPSDRLFLVSQLMKEILLELEYSPKSKQDFLDFCTLQYEDNPYQSNLIQEFRNNYQASTSIRWYTNESFIYSILNKAFRIRDIDILIQMGFFIRDLHQEIQRLHSKLNKQNRLMAYRGQGISEEAFQNILNNNNGFLSFNNFFIAIIDKQIAHVYARSARDNHGLIGVVFRMEIDQTKSIFIPLDDEILFSTHTIFRISDVQQIEDGLWEIKLRSMGNEDKDLKISIRKDIEGKNKLERLNILRTQLGIING